ncbi:MAG TPA: head GIN domain-containing protein [Prolixibacteraceae bacterium]|nr:head GIN domain-containing protein [Prolixibacteraceae bacterium]
MKKIIFLLTLILPSLLSCQLKADNWLKSVHGNGNVTKETRQVKGFDGIKASAGIDVYLFQGNEEKVVVESDENLHDCIITEVKGSTLHCYIDCNVRSSKVMKVYVNYKMLNKINASSGSDVLGETLLKTDNLDVEVSSGADVKVEVDAQTVHCDVSSGSDALLKGKADHFQGSASSGADLKADELVVNSCEADASSAGDIKITVKKQIRASASSGGDVTYFGNPENENINESSGGDVHRR